MKDQKINSSNDISINQKVYRKEIGDLYANFDTERSHNKKMHPSREVGHFDNGALLVATG